jgi:Domain of unknown function (DUF4337)
LTAAAASPEKAPRQRRKPVEATEISEQIEHEDDKSKAAAAEDRDKLRRIAGIYVGVVAVLLAIASLGGARATKEMLNANIHASDTYAYSQAKRIRNTGYTIAADQLEWQLAANPALPEAAKAEAAAAIRHYRAAASREESDPQSGEGRQQLLAKAREFEAERDHARERDPNFEIAEALYQIAIVLGSVSIVAASPALLTFSGAIAVLGALLTLNGYLLLVPIPLG